MRSSGPRDGSPLTGADGISGRPLPTLHCSLRRQPCCPCLQRRPNEACATGRSLTIGDPSARPTHATARACPRTQLRVHAKAAASPRGAHVAADDNLCRRTPRPGTGARHRATPHTRCRHCRAEYLRAAAIAGGESHRPSHRRPTGHHCRNHHVPAGTVLPSAAPGCSKNSASVATHPGGESTVRRFAHGFQEAFPHDAPPRRYRRCGSSPARSPGTPTAAGTGGLYARVDLLRVGEAVPLRAHSRLAVSPERYPRLDDAGAEALMADAVLSSAGIHIWSHCPASPTRSTSVVMLRTPASG